MRKNDECYPHPARDTGEKGSQRKSLFACAYLCLKGFPKVPLKFVTDFCNKNINIGIGCDHGVKTLSCEISCDNFLDVDEHRVSSQKSDTAISSQELVDCSSKNKSKAMNTLLNTLDKAKALYQVVLMCRFKNTVPVCCTNLSQEASSSQEFSCKKTQGNLMHEQKFLTKQNREVSTLRDQVCLSNSFNRFVADKSWDTEEGKRLIARMRYFLIEEGKDGFSLSDKAILRSGNPISETHGFYEFEPGELESFTPISYDPEEGNFIVNE